MKVNKIFATSAKVFLSICLFSLQSFGGIEIENSCRRLFKVENRELRKLFQIAQNVLSDVTNSSGPYRLTSEYAELETIFERATGEKLSEVKQLNDHQLLGVLRFLFSKSPLRTSAILSHIKDPGSDDLVLAKNETLVLRVDAIEPNNISKTIPSNIRSVVLAVDRIEDGNIFVVREKGKEDIRFKYDLHNKDGFLMITLATASKKANDSKVNTYRVRSAIRVSPEFKGVTQHHGAEWYGQYSSFLQLIERLQLLKSVLLDPYPLIIDGKVANPKKFVSDLLNDLNYAKRARSVDRSQMPIEISGLVLEVLMHSAELEHIMIENSSIGWLQHHGLIDGPMSPEKFNVPKHFGQFSDSQLRSLVSKPSLKRFEGLALKLAEYLKKSKFSGEDVEYRIPEILQEFIAIETLFLRDGLDNASVKRATAELFGPLQKLMGSPLIKETSANSLFLEVLFADWRLIEQSRHLPFLK